MNERYPLPPFRIRDRALIARVMRQWPLATLFSGTGGAAAITMLPLLTREDGDELTLLGHLDANNEHAESIECGAPISFQFRGPDSYASPDLYPDPHLPGWLYISVHGNGSIESILNGDELRKLLVASTNKFGDKNQRFSLAADDERIDYFIGGIKGFSIRVTEISGIAKLAQDKGREHAEIAARFLLGRDAPGTAQLIDELLASSQYP